MAGRKEAALIVNKLYPITSHRRKETRRQGHSTPEADYREKSDCIVGALNDESLALLTDNSLVEVQRSRLFQTSCASSPSFA